MITTITIYITEDGTRFDSLDRAKKYEAWSQKIAAIMLPLGRPHDEVRTKKQGWIQHNNKIVIAARCELLKLIRPRVRSFTELYKAIKTTPETVNPHGIMGRISCDSSGDPFWNVWDNAWRRFGCIDANGREFEQPYFTIHGPDADFVCIQDRS